MTASAKIDFQPFKRETPQDTSVSVDFTPYQEVKKQPIKEVGRHVARSAARVGEMIAGLPGDIANAPAALANMFSKSKPGKDLLGEGEHPEFVEAFKLAKHISPFGAPTSSELREKTKERSGGYLEPQSKGEKLADAIVSDFASLAIPVKGKVPFLRSLGKALFVAAGSNLAEKGVEMVGGGEKSQLATKIGSMFLLSAFNPNGAKKYADSLYKEARELVPKGATAEASNLTKDLGAFRTELKKGATAPYKANAMTKVNEIQAKIKKGKIPVEELTEFKIDINKARDSLYTDQTLDKGGRRLAKKNLDSVSKIVDNALYDYGKVNPAWEKSYRPANEVYGAIAQSKKVSNAVARFIKSHPHSTGTALVAEVFLAPKTLPLAAGAIGLVKTGELITRIAKSPTLRKYYMGVVESALKDDAASLAKNINKLEAAYKKESSD